MVKFILCVVAVVKFVLKAIRWRFSQNQGIKRIMFSFKSDVCLVNYNI